MLVLQRKRGEMIRIGNQGEIAVKVLSHHKGVIRIGIDAPKDMLVNREEVHQKLQHEQSPTPHQELVNSSTSVVNDEEIPSC